MRADRLVEVLLLLQQRGQVTAREVAEELEISERTARRDLDALGMAGLPVYSVQGRNGGWRLLGDGRTDLSGLSADEVRALFSVAGPSGADPEVRSALRKLVRALPETFRTRAERAATTIVEDRAPWGREHHVRMPQWLAAVQDAVVSSAEVELDYVNRSGDESRRTIEPLGLASKGANWYLLAETAAGRRTFRLDRVRGVEPTGRSFEPPPDFDLHAEWQSVVEVVDQQRAPVGASGRLRLDVLLQARWLFGSRLRLGPAVGDGWIAVEIRGQAVESLAAEAAGFGADLVLDRPADVCDRLAVIGRELVETYGG